MLRKLLLVAALGVAGCFSPTEPICSFACADSTPRCPPDYVCAGDGYCHLMGHENEACGFSDAAVMPSDMSVQPTVDMPRSD